MSSDYSNVVKRLAEYRQRLSLTQTEMGKCLGVNQSHYYKLEIGIKIISYRSLQYFIKCGGDVFYLLTGEKKIYGELDQYLSMCKTDDGKSEFLKVLIWVITQGLRLDSSKEELSETTYKSLYLAEYERRNTKIWKNIRQMEGITQQEMSLILDINIKRYRKIEKEECKPDAEILCTLYNKLKYSPMIILNREKFYLDEMNKIWTNFTYMTKKRLRPMINQAIIIVNEYESVDKL